MGTPSTWLWPIYLDRRASDEGYTLTLYEESNHLMPFPVNPSSVSISSGEDASLRQGKILHLQVIHEKRRSYSAFFR